jgi:hypothetical protein
LVIGDRARRLESEVTLASTSAVMAMLAWPRMAETTSSGTRLSRRWVAAVCLLAWKRWWPMPASVQSLAHYRLTLCAMERAEAATAGRPDATVVPLAVVASV